MLLPVAQLAFNFIDLCVLVLLLIGVFGGLKRGLSGEVFRILSLALAALAAWQVTPALDERVASWTGWAPDVSMLVVAGVLIATVLFGCWFIGKMLRKVATFAFNKSVERTGGAIVGLLRAAFVSLYFLSLGSVVPDEGLKTRVTAESLFGGLASRHVTPWLRNHVPAPSPSHSPADTGHTTEPPPENEDPYATTGESLEPVDSLEPLPLLDEATSTDR